MEKRVSQVGGMIAAKFYGALRYQFQRFHSLRTFTSLTELDVNR
jgi:hypothetical protein